MSRPNPNHVRGLLEARRRPTPLALATIYADLAIAGGDETDAQALSDFLFRKKKPPKRRVEATPQLPFAEGDLAATETPSGPGQGKILAIVHPEGIWTARRPSSLQLPLVFCDECLELDLQFSARLTVGELWEAWLRWLGPARRGLAGSPLTLPKALNRWAEPQLDQGARNRLRKAAGRERLRGLLAGRETRGTQRPRCYLGIRLRGA